MMQQLPHETHDADKARARIRRARAYTLDRRFDHGRATFDAVNELDNDARRAIRDYWRNERGDASPGFGLLALAVCALPLVIGAAWLVADLCIAWQRHRDALALRRR